MTVELGTLLVAVGAILGSGVTWGIMQQTVQSHTRRLEDLERICEHQRSNCPSNLNALISPLHEKLNKLSTDMAYIRGKWEKEEKGK